MSKQVFDGDILTKGVMLLEEQGSDPTQQTGIGQLYTKSGKVYLVAPGGTAEALATEIFAGGAVDAGNGITDNSGTFNLGGTLTGNVAFNGAYEFSVGYTTPNSSIYLKSQSGIKRHYYYKIIHYNLEVIYRHLLE